MATDTTTARSRISRLEWMAATAAALVLAGLVVAEPDVLGAPVENARTVLFTLGGTVLAAIALVVMVRRRVPPVVRLLVLGVPFVATSWWLLAPFFRDTVVDEAFETSIAAAAEGTTTTTAPVGPAGPDPSTLPGDPPTTPTVPPPTGPRLLGAGSFVGLAGHEGSGDAGFFELPDGSLVLRLERFDIQNGPDLRLYVVPGGEQVSPGDGTIDLGRLRGNVGDQTYDLPPGTSLDPGDWTVLVWCDAFSVEFVASTVTLTA